MPVAKKVCQVKLGEKIGLQDLVAVARFGARVEFSESYCNRVNRSRSLIEQAISQERVMYGVTTGFGLLSTKTIDREQAKTLQKNIILSHSVSVGEPFDEEQARATMLMILQNLGQGYSGVRLGTLETIRSMLNGGVTPWMPRDGSVGYLAPEAHLALVLTGEGKAWFSGELLPGGEAMRRAGIEPIELAEKEGLALISGTTSVTALAALAAYDMVNAVKCADVVGAVSLEALKGVMQAFDGRVMSVRPHSEQAVSAANVRKLLGDSEVIRHYAGSRLQDALSLRCIPQLHGAARKTIHMAVDTLETEINSCCDNPIIWDNGDSADVLSACNCDSAYAGIAMDSAAIACTMIAKMSERRNNRLIDETMSGFPSFLVKNPGLNSGLMIPQYTQAGLLGDMRILSTPSVIDNTPTCCGQEDYVAMGYNACKKAGPVVRNLEYILAIELLSGYQAQKFLDPGLRRSRATAGIFTEIGKAVPDMENDVQLYPHIEYLRGMIHSGKLLDLAQQAVGDLG